MYSKYQFVYMKLSNFLLLVMVLLLLPIVFDLLLKPNQFEIVQVLNTL